MNTEETIVSPLEAGLAEAVIEAAFAPEIEPMLTEEVELKSGKPYASGDAGSSTYPWAG